MKRKIKVGIVSPYFFPHYGGVTTYVYNQYIWLKRFGFDVKIISPDFGSSKENISAEDHIKLGKPLSVLSNGSLSYIAIPVRAKEVLEREKFDLLHIHEPYHPFSFWFLRYDIPSVATFHIFREDTGIAFSLGEPFFKFIRKNITFAIAVSRTASLMVEEFFRIPSEKIKIIPNGVDFNFFSNAVPYDFLRWDGIFNILFVGRLEPRKGVKHLIRAYRLVKRVLHNSKLIIAGRGLLTYYASFLTEDIQEDVIFLTDFTYQELPRIYKSADICVFPSTRGESFGIVLLEAMSAGKPIVSGNAAGYVELLRGGEYGEIVDPKDEDSLARAIIKLYFDKEKREEIARKGYEYAKQFDWQNIIAKIARLYLEILKGSYEIYQGENANLIYGS